LAGHRAIASRPPVLRPYRFLPVRLSSEDLRRIHGTNERIAVKDYADMVRFYITLMRLAAG